MESQISDRCSYYSLKAITYSVNVAMNNRLMSRYQSWYRLLSYPIPLPLPPFGHPSWSPNLPFLPEGIYSVLLLVKHRRIFANCSLCTTTPSPEKRTKIGESFLRRRLYTGFRNLCIYSSFIAIVKVSFFSEALMLIVKEIFSTKNHLKLFLFPSRLCPKWLKSCS